MANSYHHDYERPQEGYQLQGGPFRASEESSHLEDTDATLTSSRNSIASSTSYLAIDLGPAESICSDIHPEDVFEPVDPPSDFPPLDYRPLTLKPWFLILTFIFFVTCEVGIITLIVLSHTNSQILHFRNSRHRLIIKYSPAIIGTITNMWFRVIASTYNRIFPYVAMASVPVPRRGRRKPFTFNTMCGINLMSASDWKLRDLVKYRYWVAFAVNCTFSLNALLLVPVKAGLLTITEDSDNGGWATDVSFLLSAVSAFLYVSLASSVISILISLDKVSTGLKWEPASIASQLSILHKFDFHEAFNGMDFALGSHMSTKIQSWTFRYGTLRLGYWKHRNTGIVAYCMRFMAGQEYGESSFPINEPSSPRVTGHTRNRVLSKSRCRATYNDAEAPLDCNNKILRNPELSKIGYLPIFLTDLWILALEIVGLSGIIACIVTIALGLEDTVIRLPDSALEFVDIGENIKISVLYSSLLAFLYNLFSLTLILADQQFRSMQSICNMETPQMADESILLDYISPDPITIFITSFKKCHWRVAWHTFLASSCQIAPISAGHVFTRNRQGLKRAMFINPPNFYISIAIMGVYCIALPFARPPSGYRTPRPLRTLFDLALYCYHSQLPLLQEFEVQRRTDTQEHLNAKILLTRRRYQFGLYVGKPVCQRRHLGISPDKMKHDDEVIQPVHRIVVDSDWYRFMNIWIRPPRVESPSQRIVTCAPDRTNHNSPSTSLNRHISEISNNEAIQSTADEDVEIRFRRSQPRVRFQPDNEVVSNSAPTVTLSTSTESGKDLLQDTFQTAIEPRELTLGITRKRTGDFGQPRPSH